MGKKPQPFATKRDGKEGKKFISELSSVFHNHFPYHLIVGYIHACIYVWSKYICKRAQLCMYYIMVFLSRTNCTWHSGPIWLHHLMTSLAFDVNISYVFI